MKKVITAIGNPILNIKLKQEKELVVIGNDIQYQEGIFEVLEKEEDIDFLILSEIIPGELSPQKLIEKIKLINYNIKIIIILENKNEELENILIAKGIFKILYNNQIEIKDMIKIIKKEEINFEKEELKKEINDLKRLMLEKQKKEREEININIKKENKNEETKSTSLQIVSQNRLLQKIMSAYYIRQYKRKSIRKEVISISGPSGVRKKYYIN